jgi:hypothetical protein
VAEEVVLADLLVEDLAAEAVDSVVDGSFSGVARVEVGNRLCKHSITKKSCKLQLFFVITLCVITSKH